MNKHRHRDVTDWFSSQTKKNVQTGGVLRDLLERAKQMAETFDESVRYPRGRIVSQNSSKTDMSGVDLSLTDCSGVDFHNSMLAGANFEGANLSHANFNGADLTGATLRRADMISTTMRHARMSGTDLRHTDIIDCDMRGAQLTGVLLNDANLTGVDFTDARLARVNFTRCDFFAVILKGTEVTGCNWTGVRLECVEEIVRAMKLERGGTHGNTR